MSREAHIPLVLWIPAAILMHWVGGEGAVEVAEVVEERAEVRAMVHAVRDSLRPDTTFEILVDAPPTPATTAMPPPEKAPDDAKVKPDATPEKPDPIAEEKKRREKARLLPPKDPPKDPPKLAKKDPPPPPTAKKDPPPPPPKLIAKVEPVKPPPPAVAPPPPPPPVVPEKRIAVKQNVKKDQADNPNASRIADDANHTEQESMAKVRSYDQDAPEPTAGSGGTAKGDPGNSSLNKVAQSEEKHGDHDHAPGESKPDSTSAVHESPGRSAPPSSAIAGREPAQNASGSRGAGGATASRAAEASAASPGGSGPASPEVSASANGGWRIDPANPGGDGKSRVAGEKRAAAQEQPPMSVSTLGLGAPGVPGRPNLNLTMSALEAAVGKEQLKRERAADGAARRTAHRGSSDPNQFQRLRPAIENYEPSVKLGNQTSLNAARAPFASYLNAIHNRIHPIFAEEFLEALENLPAAHKMNQHLVTHVEIVLSKDEGRIVRLGVTRNSGSTAFDAVALSSVRRASPFGQAPDAVVSSDGNVYLHWEFHRDPFDACSTRNARPYLLKGTQPVEPAPLAPRRPLPSEPTIDERGTQPLPVLPLR